MMLMLCASSRACDSSITRPRGAPIPIKIRCGLLVSGAIRIAWGVPFGRVASMRILSVQVGLVVARLGQQGCLPLAALSV